MKDFVHKRKKLYGFEKEEIFFIVKTFWDVTSFIATTAAVIYSNYLKPDMSGILTVQTCPIVKWSGF